MSSTKRSTNTRFIRLMLGLLVGALLIGGSLWGGYAYLSAKLEEKTERMAPYVLVIIEAQEDPVVLSSMIEDADYNRFALTWMFHLAQLEQSGAPDKDLKEAILGAAANLDGTDLHILMQWESERVYGLTGEQKAAYAEVGRPDYNPKLEFSPDFLSAWKSCHGQLNNAFSGQLGFLRMSMEIAFGRESVACPELNKLSRNALKADGFARAL